MQECQEKCEEKDEHDGKNVVQCSYSRLLMKCSIYLIVLRVQMFG